jgi:HK97 family phage prohead protease
VFGETIRVWDPWDGEYDERFAAGAFTKTLRERTPYMMFNHGRHPLVGSLPIGTYTELAEDRRGLFVRGTLGDNWLVQPVRDAIASGAVSGMSIMFEPMKDTRDDSGDFPLITRTEVKLLEAGPVVFPAYESTSVGVRSVLDLNDLRHLNPATSRAAAPAGTDDEEAGTQPIRAADDEPSTPIEVLDAYARCVARRYPS